MTTRRLIGQVFRFASRVFFCLVVLPLLYCLWPFCRVRIGLMHTQRIGHLAGNTEIFFRRLQLDGRPPRTVYFMVGWEPANRQLMDMFLRLKVEGAHLRESLWLTRLVFSWRPILMHTRFWFPNRISDTEFHVYANTKPVIAFTDEEERRGRAALAEMGIGESDWFICFHARDGSYYREWRPQFESKWASIDVMNCSIENYLRAAEYITSLGGFAIRMGAVVEAPLPATGNSRIIDYATRYRSDFMDIYLCARCRFFVGTCSGLTHVPIAFDRPIIYANHVIFDSAPLHRYDLMIPRLLVTPDEHRIVGFQEAKENGFRLWNKWNEATFDADRIPDVYSWRENNPEDILDVCKDMVDRLEGRELPAEAKRMQDEYSERYFSHLPDYPLGGRIGARFAFKYKHLIVPDAAPPGKEEIN